MNMFSAEIFKQDYCVKMETDIHLSTSMEMETQTAHYDKLAWNCGDRMGTLSLSIIISSVLNYLKLEQSM